MSSVSIIIVNYNTYDLCKTCISTVYKFTKGLDFEIILVDNNSPERDIENIKKDYPEVGYIQNSSNSGFADANNIGISYAKFDNILLLNSDIELIENSIKVAVDYISQHKDTGVVGVKLIYADGKVQYAPRRFRDLKWEFLDWLRPFVRLLPDDKKEDLMLGRYSKNQRTMEVDMVPGAFFLTKKSIVEQLPESKLDDRYFMYGEDYLWCWQIKNLLGLKIVFIADTEVVHHLSASTSPEKRIALTKVMVNNHLETSRYIYGRGLYYYLFKLLYTTKEYSRMWVKNIMSKLNLPIPR